MSDITVAMSMVWISHMPLKSSVTGYQGPKRLWYAENEQACMMCHLTLLGDKCLDLLNGLT